MQSLKQHLIDAQRNDAVLFCGAGFSADCLNLSLDKIGTTSPLLQILNEHLGEPHFNDVSLAAQEFIDKIGEYKLFNLICERYQIDSIPDNVFDILNYDWKAIYTTNYDDVIEKCLEKLKKPYTSVNNTDSPDYLSPIGTQIIHLHGAIRHWGDLSKFSNSCVLSAESYLRHSASSKWNKRLLLDFSRSTAFVFVGFSASDIYLNQILHNHSECTDKTFFINSVNSGSDRELLVRQRSFGRSLAIGRDGLSLEIRATRGVKPTNLTLRNFKRFDPEQSPDSIPSNDKIRSLFMFGKHDQSCLKWDVDNSACDYRVDREITNEVTEHTRRPGAIAFLVGNACSGKSLTAQEVMTRNSRTREVYQLSVAYDNVVDEAKEIMAKDADAFLVVETPFSMREESLLELVKIVSESGASLLLTSRGIIFDSLSHLNKALSSFSGYKVFEFGKLGNEEIESLIALTERIAGWHEFDGKVKSEKLNYIKRDCNSQIPEFLLKLLDSPNIRSTIESEYKNTINKHPELKKILIASLYFKHIDVSMNTLVFSSLLGDDSAALIKNCENEFARVKNGAIETIPTFGAQTILKEIIPDDSIISLIIELVKELIEFGNLEGSFYQTFRRLTTYSLIKACVQDKSQIERFFDELSAIPRLRGSVQFWIHYHIYKMDMKQFDLAKDFLENAFSEAELFSKRSDNAYDYKQLNNLKVKYILTREIHSSDSTNTAHILKECLPLIRKNLAVTDITYHTYNLLGDLANFIKIRSNLGVEIYSIFLKVIDEIIETAENKVHHLEAGFAKNVASENVMALRSAIAKK